MQVTAVNEKQQLASDQARIEVRALRKQRCRLSQAIKLEDPYPLPNRQQPRLLRSRTYHHRQYQAQKLRLRLP